MSIFRFFWVDIINDVSSIELQMFWLNLMTSCIWRLGNAHDEGNQNLANASFRFVKLISPCSCRFECEFMAFRERFFLCSLHYLIPYWRNRSFKKRLISSILLLFGSFDLIVELKNYCEWCFIYYLWSKFSTQIFKCIEYLKG